jgi:hypothetical protein
MKVANLNNRSQLDNTGRSEDLLISNNRTKIGENGALIEESILNSLANEIKILKHNDYGYLTLLHTGLDLNDNSSKGNPYNNDDFKRGYTSKTSANIFQEMNEKKNKDFKNPMDLILYFEKESFNNDFEIENTLDALKRRRITVMNADNSKRKEPERTVKGEIETMEIIQEVRTKKTGCCTGEYKGCLVI